ncbi:10917_t:CDS:2 [Entrophospora sp. SA101]|nr:9701_t:CDS:2 [Entrophospora sp. SA101]CAJ0904213.1 10917_t:CDS:2 [Entrophospora sp. SA101]
MGAAVEHLWGFPHTEQRKSAISTSCTVLLGQYLKLKPNERSKIKEEEKSSVNIQYITETQKDYKKKTFLSIVLNKRKYDDFGLDPEYKANLADHPNKVVPPLLSGVIDEEH